MSSSTAGVSHISTLLLGSRVTQVPDSELSTTNPSLALLPCIGIIPLVVTGIDMWWKRRPSGKLASLPTLMSAAGLHQRRVSQY